MTDRPAGCAAVPDSSGPASAVARLTMSAPRSATSGSRVAVDARVEVRSDAPRIITDPSRSMILVTRAGRVIGTTPSTSKQAVPMPLANGTSRPAQALPRSVLLAACGSDGGAAVPLPPGDYELVGVLGYGDDALNSAPDGGAARQAFALVSPPAPITVR